MAVDGVDERDGAARMRRPAGHGTGGCPCERGGTTEQHAVRVPVKHPCKDMRVQRGGRTVRGSRPWRCGVGRGRAIGGDIRGRFGRPIGEDFGQPAAVWVSLVIRDACERFERRHPRLCRRLDHGQEDLNLRVFLRGSETHSCRRGCCLRTRRAGYCHSSRGRGHPAGRMRDRGGCVC
jgi:hypothetical protein